MLTTAQEEDCIRHLQPLVLSIARRMEFEWSKEPRELQTHAYMGALAAARLFDGQQSNSLWAYAASTIRRHMVDEERVVAGKKGGRRLEMSKHVPVGLFQSSTSSSEADSFDSEFLLPWHVEPGYEELENRDHVDSLLRRASPMYREILTRVYLGEEQKKDVAQDLGVDPSTLSVMLNHATQQIRRAA